ncbi:hypothetical protein JZ751_016849 [Albula glossodonta]|uniref:Uncharacterized protein n=1 Tax=Albula glossodonta TaxID=121402 RepID=A0A8T2P121_9TELE|nr:hypothetical protein JZ751_016849 [Albula glossodonta]
MGTVTESRVDRKRERMRRLEKREHGTVQKAGLGEARRLKQSARMTIPQSQPTSLLQTAQERALSNNSHSGTVQKAGLGEARRLKQSARMTIPQSQPTSLLQTAQERALSNNSHVIE